MFIFSGFIRGPTIALHPQPDLHTGKIGQHCLAGYNLLLIAEHHWLALTSHTHVSVIATRYEAISKVRAHDNISDSLHKQLCYAHDLNNLHW